jgi:hypothetical protein
MGGGNEERGVLINVKPNQGVRERKKVGNCCSNLLKKLNEILVRNIRSTSTK